MSKFKEKTFWVNIELRALAFHEYEDVLNAEEARKEMEERIKSDLNKLGYLDPYSVNIEVK